MTADPRRVLLVGMMGVGKTTVGRLLAARLGCSYVDNDELLQRSTGRTARELLATGGVDDLRAGEAAALELALREPPPVVIGVAAGVVLDPSTRKALRDGGTVVWLRAAPATLVRRTTDGGRETPSDPEGARDAERGSGVDHRPAFPDPARPAEWFERESAARAPLYRAVATATVDVDRPDGTDRPPDEIVDEIVDGLPSRRPG